MKIKNENEILYIFYYLIVFFHINSKIKHIIKAKLNKLY